MEANLKKRLEEKRAKGKLDINEERRRNELDFEKKSGGQAVNLRKAIMQKVGVID